MPKDVDGLRFDAPVRLLRYAEMFVTPVLLVVCPVENQPTAWWYLWLQEYIRVVLDFDNLDWRDNRESVRVAIPGSNSMPGQEGHLSFIARHPKRLRAWAQVARIHHELKYCIPGSDPQINRDGLAKARTLLRDLDSVWASLETPDWEWARSMRDRTVNPALRAGDLLLRGGPFVPDDLNGLDVVNSAGIPLEGEVDDEEARQELLRFEIAAQLMRSVQSMSAALASANDVGLTRTLWEESGEHDF